VAGDGGLTAVVRRLLATLLTASVLVPSFPARTAPGAADLEAYRGLGAWVDLFEERAWRRPAAAVADMDAHGVRTLYLETSNYSQRRAVVDPGAVARFVDAAHARGMQVVAWYLPGFDRLRRDLVRSMRAIRFRSPSGEGFDSFALDIEASIVDPASKRSKRLLTLSRKIRARVGPGYPLGAITPSPYRMERGNTWDGFPFDRLAEFYDVFLPMSYFTFHVEGEQRAHDEVAASIPIIRERTGDPTIPIHVIGGIADRAAGPEVRGMVHASREHGVIGASLYNWSLSREHDWAELRKVPVNPKQSPALPVLLPVTGALGYLPAGDRTHPAEVFVATGPLAGTRTLTFEAFDLQPGEVELMVNWQSLGPLPAGDGWASHAIPIPDEVLRDTRPNVIGFMSAASHPDWREWGVQSIAIG
jgi:hypothetical protein